VPGPFIYSILMSTQQVRLSHTDISMSSEEIWSRFPLAKLIDLPVEKSEGVLSSLYKTRVFPLALRHRIWSFFNKTNLDTHWLDQFNIYWTQILSGRPILGVLDFAYLHGVHREKFYQYGEAYDYMEDSHLDAWQQSEVLFQLINLVYRESQHSDTYKASMIKYAPSSGHILEFGAAISPITRSLHTFGISTRTIYIADLPTYAFHYACFRWREKENIKPIVLLPENEFKLPANKQYGIIFCVEVFEHLPDPVTTIRMFYDLLLPDGILVFDYIKSDATGLDTSAGLEYREQVLDFVRDNFTLVLGDLSDTSCTIGLTVVRK